MSQNFDLKTRDMSKAAHILLSKDQREGAISFSTVATVLERFEHFKRFAKEKGVARFERVSSELVRSYAQHLKKRIFKKRNLSAAYAANMLSAVNSVMSRAHSHNGTKWTPVTGREVNLERRTRTRTNKTVTREQSSKAIEQLSPRTTAIANLARELGLRSKEASLINAKKALADATNKSFVAIEAGTKGGRYREVPITNQLQIEALKKAAQIQGQHHSLVPQEQSWVVFREGELRDGRELLKKHGVAGYHELRAAYAAERYHELTGQTAPINGGKINNKEVDLDSRLQISNELGHGRAEVLNAYVGGKK
ncbi:MAG: integrase domain-containing protein [Pseudomonas sp.]|nr:integrase domain-containing protein [Pseudomonas sp.]